MSLAQRPLPGCPPLAFGKGRLSRVFQGRLAKNPRFPTGVVRSNVKTRFFALLRMTNLPYVILRSAATPARLSRVF
jgi:hypothetical protein